MGGAIAVGFSALHPQLVRRLVSPRATSSAKKKHIWLTLAALCDRQALLAPAGFHVHVPLSAKLAKLPLLGDVLMPILGPYSLRIHAVNGYAHPEDPLVAQLIQREGVIGFCRVDGLRLQGVHACSV
jgi:hypothetical protein